MGLFLTNDSKSGILGVGFSDDLKFGVRGEELAEPL
jgi:hypothetical protein